VLVSTTSPDGLINISYKVSFYVNLLLKHGALFRKHGNPNTKQAMSKDVVQ
jgi:hypothetical protein